MIITKDNEPIYRKANGTYLMRHPLTGQVNYWCGFPDDPNGCHADVEKYLSDHPEAVQPEPLPPPPSDAQLESQVESTRQALFLEYDLKIKMLTRAEYLGDTNATAKILEWHLYAKALQELNNTENWYKDTIWPVKPEED